jgi:WD40 repeat protein
VILWDVPDRSPIKALEGHKGDVSSVVFSADGKTLASGGADGRVILWDVPSRSPIKALEGHKGDVSSVAFSADGKTLASGGARREGDPVGYVTDRKDSDGYTLTDAGQMKPDARLRGARVKITLDTLYAADYPGHGDHHVLFDWGTESRIILLVVWPWHTTHFLTGIHGGQVGSFSIRARNKRLHSDW